MSNIYGITGAGSEIIKLYNLLQNIVVTKDDILLLVEDGYDYSEEEVEYLQEHLLDLTADLIDYLIDECTQDALASIIDTRLYIWHKDQSNTTS